MVRKVGHGHYLAESPMATLMPPPAYIHRSHSRSPRGYLTDEESQRAPSDRTTSECMIANERASVINAYRKDSPKRHFSNHDNEEIYVTSGAYRAPSEISHYSYRSARVPSEISTVKTKTSRKGGLMIETMAAPNPFCPNTKGICCLMLLINLGLILVTLGFVVVTQFYEPVFVWVLGIVFLVFGFLTLIGSLIYAVYVCRDAKSPSEVNPDDLYWTHHWQKHIGPSEIHYRAEDKYHDDRHSISKYSGKHSNRSGRY